MAFTRGYQYLSRDQKKGRRASEGGALANWECYSQRGMKKRFVHEKAAIEFCEWFNASVKERPQDYSPGEVCQYKYIGR